MVRIDEVHLIAAPREIGGNARTTTIAARARPALGGSGWSSQHRTGPGPGGPRDAGRRALLPAPNRASSRRTPEATAYSCCECEQEFGRPDVLVAGTGGVICSSCGTTDKTGAHVLPG
ncbi:hypothetical protein [Saccharopolyspora halophila]